MNYTKHDEERAFQCWLYGGVGMCCFALFVITLYMSVHTQQITYLYVGSVFVVLGTFGVSGFLNSFWKV